MLVNPYAFSNNFGSPRFDPLFDQTKLLVQFEGVDGATSFTDAADGRTVTTVGNAQLDTDQARFGAASLRLDGAGDYLSVPNSVDFQVRLSDGDFTVEAFVRLDAGAGAKNNTIVSTRTPSNGDGFVFTYSNTEGKLLGFVLDNTVGFATCLSASVMAEETWYHVAYTRKGTTYRVFIDGVLEGQTTNGSTPTVSSDTLKIGRDPSNTSRDWDGWIEEVRFTRACRYDKNFVPPTAPFPVIGP